MYDSVSPKEKHVFLKWFLENHKMKNRKSIRILMYLLNNETLLDKIYFVHEVEYSPRSIVISTQCSDQVPFLFSKEHLSTMNVEKAFHDLRLNKYDALYIKLNFRNAERNYHYVGVIEENPFILDKHNEIDVNQADGLLDQLTYDYNRNFIGKQIDLALDQANNTTFLEWSFKLRKLQSEYENRPIS